MAAYFCGCKASVNFRCMLALTGLPSAASAPPTPLPEVLATGAGLSAAGASDRVSLTTSPDACMASSESPSDNVLQSVSADRPCASHTARPTDPMQSRYDDAEGGSWLLDAALHALWKRSCTCLFTSWAALWRMRPNMLRKPLFLEGVRLCCKPMVLIQSGAKFATSSGLHPLRP